MAIGKTLSVVLSVTPYRESSILAALFSRGHGRINGIAKGIRRADRRRVPIERGYIIEHIVYLKEHGDLHTITDCSIVEYFPLLRGDLEKSAVRDLLFDLVLSSVPAGDSHPELYDFVAGFLYALQAMRGNYGDYCAYLSNVLFRFAARLGFSLDFRRCSSCGGSTTEPQPVWLSIERGLLRCDRCSSGSGSTADRLLSAAMVQWYTRNDGKRPPAALREAFAALRLAYDYCRYHLDIRKNLESFAFMEHLAGM